MKKLLNKAEDFARETVEGIVCAHPESLKMLNDSWHCLVRADKKKEGKVAIATGGGSGHLPVFLGYVGYGLADDLPFETGSEVAVLVNGLGATPKEELYIAYRKLYKILQEKNIKIHRKYIGEYATSLEMAGMSISLLKLDNELKELIDAPCYSPFFEQSR
ncbi:MAG: dihydroxyacetone kinase DhaK subunit [Firmicutes bacterium]|nr:dihydroxyacetone kinase DhaK subunit [Bacillota bacterium]